MDNSKKILNILTVYNEMNFMPLKKKWCEMNGLDLYVIDNMSNDGTWEWLQENKIPSHRIDTQGAFDLRILQGEINKVIHKIKPWWVIYNGADLFPVTRGRIYDDVSKVNEMGYNAIKLNWIMFYNTGEKRGDFDPFNTFFYCGLQRGVAMIVKYHPSMKVSADEITRKNRRDIRIDGVIINYGHTKTVKEREETYARRKLAWKRGMNKGWGIHYGPGHERGWIWQKEKLIDVRESEYWWAIQKLQSI